MISAIMKRFHPDSKKTDGVSVVKVDGEKLVVPKRKDIKAL